MGRFKPFQIAHRNQKLAQPEPFPLRAGQTALASSRTHSAASAGSGVRFGEHIQRYGAGGKLHRAHDAGPDQTGLSGMVAPRHPLDRPDSFADGDDSRARCARMQRPAKLSCNWNDPARLATGWIARVVTLLSGKARSSAGIALKMAARPVLEHPSSGRSPAFSTFSENRQLPRFRFRERHSGHSR